MLCINAEFLVLLHMYIKHTLSKEKNEKKHNTKQPYVHSRIVAAACVHMVCMCGDHARK